MNEEQKDSLDGIAETNGDKIYEDLVQRIQKYVIDCSKEQEMGLFIHLLKDGIEITSSYVRNYHEFNETQKRDLYELIYAGRQVLDATLMLVKIEDYIRILGGRDEAKRKEVESKYRKEKKRIERKKQKEK